MMISSDSALLIWDDLSQGFVNYFGTQRFGSWDIGTEQVGKFILQRKWREAAQAIMGSKNAHSQLVRAIVIQ